ncbi:kinase-like protein [Venturia nashicola]|nr:kinase-like protein [Venturia nashicola]
MTDSSAPLGNINAARRPNMAPTFSRRGGSGINANSDIAARMKAFQLGRQGMPTAPRPGVNTANSANPSPNQQNPNGAAAGIPPAASSSGGTTPTGPGGVPAGFQMPNSIPTLKNLHSAPAVPGLRGPAAAARKPTLAEKRGLVMPGGLPPASSASPAAPPAGKKKKPGLSLSQLQSDEAPVNGHRPGESLMDKYSDFLDAKTGNLNFKGKAILSSEGVEFSSGSSFSISLDEVDTLDELGKGNYGTVYKVRHSRPKMRRPGQGLAGNKVKGFTNEEPPNSPTVKPEGGDESSPVVPPKPTGGTTGVVMAMKEIRLELDDAKFAAIIMELDILHRCISPQIIDFYGAFFQEGAVYICIEFMDGGSIDKLYGDGIPEGVLKKITLATTLGLKCLKDEHNIIHRDVKPTNILMNTRGQIKICDFGVSGNLVASIAKTNIGCQSYMAPERISSGGVQMAGANPGGGTYSVQSDIWSLGLTIIECAMGRYPYPPETYNNIFSQLSAIVDGEPPDLPPVGYSDQARNFVHGCLHKIPKMRPTYGMLLTHPWLTSLTKPAAIMEEDEDAEEEAANAPAIVPVEHTPSGEDADKIPELPDNVIDTEVAEWVIAAIAKRKAGKLGKSEKPALHAAPLDAVASPVAERTTQPPSAPALEESVAEEDQAAQAE